MAICSTSSQRQRGCTLQAMRRVALIAVLILASCSNDRQTEPTDAAPPPLTTLAEALPSEDPAATTSTTSTPTTTTSTTTTTTTLPVNAKAEFGLTQVVFGGAASVVITNWGNDVGSLDGFWLAQGGSVMALPDISMAPGEQVLVGLSRTAPSELAGMAATIFLGPAIGDLALDQGEVALFDAARFDDPEHLVAYVAWGATSQTLTEVAVAAGAWVDAPVVVFDDAPSISSGVFPARDSLSWSVDLGG